MILIKNNLRFYEFTNIKMLSKLSNKLFISFVSGIAVGYLDYKGEFNKLKCQYENKLCQKENELNKLRNENYQLYNKLYKKSGPEFHQPS